MKDVSSKEIKLKDLCIIGAGGHGKVIRDIASSMGYSSIYFFDDHKEKDEHFNIVGKVKEIDQYKDCDFIIGIGNNKIREKIQNELIKKGFNVVALIHKSAVVSDSVKIGRGTVIMPNCVINADSVIGEGCIINTGATIDHDCNIQSYVHVSPGVHVAGTVEVGERTWIGIGSSVVNNVKIMNDCIFGAGTVVIKDIFNSGTYVGVPSKRIR